MQQGAGEWLAAYPEEQRKQILMDEPELLENWDEEFGDRMSELVFIEVEMNRAAIEASLDRCLFTEDEMKKDWNAFPDRLPAFTETA